MAETYSNATAFDLKLAVECANAFSGSTGLGCTISDVNGGILHEAGHGCASCAMCSAGESDPGKLACRDIQQYGMVQSERFGGQYIYFCRMGLTCFVSPIMDENKGLAKLTVGPFLMVDREDYIHFDLMEIRRMTGTALKNAKEALEKIPYAPPERVNHMSNLLFMAVGFLNNVSACNRMLETQDSDAIQGQISDFIQRLKLESPNELPRYPLEKERALMQSIVDSDRSNAQKLLNELLGHIFFTSGGEFERIKTRVYELLVLISRAAIDGGAEPEYTYNMNHRYMRQITNIASIDELCFWLSDVINQFTNMVFRFVDVKHVDVIHKSVQYIRQNYAKKLSLEEVAESVYLSPSYFSKVFKQEMGCNFNAFLNNVRIEKSRNLLLSENTRLVDISNMVGFEDQSYFTKVFKKVTGVSPCKYREAKGRIKG